MGITLEELLDKGCMTTKFELHDGTKTFLADFNIKAGEFSIETHRDDMQRLLLRKVQKNEHITKYPETKIKLISDDNDQYLVDYI